MGRDEAGEKCVHEVADGGAGWGEQHTRKVTAKGKGEVVGTKDF